MNGEATALSSVSLSFLNAENTVPAIAAPVRGLDSGAAFFPTSPPFWVAGLNIEANPFAGFASAAGFCAAGCVFCAAELNDVVFAAVVLLAAEVLGATPDVVVLGAVLEAAVLGAVPDAAVFAING